jgi:Protein of unknown function (DUF3618)
MSSPSMTELQEQNARTRERLAAETAELAHRLDVKTQVAERTEPARRRVSGATQHMKALAGERRVQLAALSAAAFSVAIVVKRRS